MSILSRLVGDGMLFRLHELSRKPGLRVLAFSLGSVTLALLAARIGPYIEADIKLELASGAVDDLLHIVATSMLAVTTFSVGIIVSALGRAGSNATPRATQLLVADPRAQNALSVFVGAFIYSIVGIIGISAGYYGGQAKIILFFVTLGVIALIVWSLLRWIDHLHHFGRTNDMIRRIEEAATEAAEAMGRQPALGAAPDQTAGDAAAPAVRAGESGYLRHIDMCEIDRLACEAGVRVHLLHLAGHYLNRGDPVMRLSAAVSPKVARALHGAVTIGAQRTFEQDMRYGLVILSEVAGRALSPAVNDPGTAIDVLRAGTRVLEAFHRCRARAEAADCTHVTAPDIDLVLAYRDLFAPIARDGAGVIEVQEVLQQSLRHLAQLGAPVPALRAAEDAGIVAVDGLDHPGDLARLREAQQGAKVRP